MERFIPAAVEGFSLGAGLIIAIGAQNAFVLRQGLARRHLLPVVLFCTFSDAMLIAIGSAGFGSLVASQPALLKVIGLGGSAFLGWYSLSAFRNALHARSLRPEERVPASLRRALAVVAALTLLNPHVYLDTVVLLGGIAGRYAADARVWFAGGAMAASAVWFFSLGYGARLLAPVFARPVAWRVLDVLIGIVMAALALMLLADAMDWSGS